MIQSDIRGLIALLFVMLVLCFAASLARGHFLSRDVKELSACAQYYKNLAHEYKAERDIALARAKSHCSFWELRKDERIEELEAENRALRDAMQKV